MSQKNHNSLDSIVTRIVHLSLKEASLHTSAMGRFWQETLKMAGVLPPPRHLVDRVLCSSSVVSDLVKHTKSYIAHLQSPKEITVRHSILSATEEHYRLGVIYRKQQSILLELHLSRCTGGLSVRVSAPRHLWLSVFLTENYSSLGFTKFDFHI